MAASHSRNNGPGLSGPDALAEDVRGPAGGEGPERGAEEEPEEQEVQVVRLEGPEGAWRRLKARRRLGAPEEEEADVQVVRQLAPEEAWRRLEARRRLELEVPAVRPGPSSSSSGPAASRGRGWRRGRGPQVHRGPEGLPAGRRAGPRRALRQPRADEAGARSGQARRGQLHQGASAEPEVPEGDPAARTDPLGDGPAR